MIYGRRVTGEIETYRSGRHPPNWRATLLTNCFRMLARGLPDFGRQRFASFADPHQRHFRAVIFQNALLIWRRASRHVDALAR